MVPPQLASPARRPSRVRNSTEPRLTLPIEHIEHDSRDEWLEARLGYVTASDAAVILGESSYKSPFALYHEKHGLEVPRDIPEEVLEWGHRMEPVIAQKFTDETGIEAHDPGDFTLTVNSDYPWLAATIDRDCYSPTRTGKGVLEIKNVGGYGAALWYEDAPLPFQIQLQHQMICAGVQWGAIAALIGGNQFRYKIYEKNEEFCKTLIEETHKFWTDLHLHKPPEATPHKSTFAALDALHPEDDGSSVVLPWDSIVIDKELQGLKQRVKDTEEEIDYRAAHIRAAIGSSTYGVTPDGQAQYSLKTQERDMKLQVSPDRVFLLEALQIPYEVIGGTKTRVLRRKETIN